jgi:hypothetical protein
LAPVRNSLLLSVTLSMEWISILAVGAAPGPDKGPAVNPEPGGIVRNPGKTKQWKSKQFPSGRYARLPKTSRHH